MSIRNCANCGGTHLGRFECPYTPEEGAAFREGTARWEAMTPEEKEAAQRELNGQASA